MLLIPFPLYLRTYFEIEMPPGENFAVNYTCENSSNEKLKTFLKNFSYWVK